MKASFLGEDHKAMHILICTNMQKQTCTNAQIQIENNKWASFVVGGEDE